MIAKQILFLPVLFSLNFSFGQTDNNDISIKYNHTLSRSDRKALALEYRRLVGHNIHIKFGLEYGKSNQELFLTNNVIDQTASTIITRQHAQFITDYNLYAGVDYSFLDYFTLGAAITGGYGSASLGIYDKGSRYDADSEKWTSCIECAYSYHGEDFTGGSTITAPVYYSKQTALNTYFIYGLNLRAGIEVPLGNAFKVGVTYEPSFRRHHFLNQEKTSDIPEPVPNQVRSFNQTDHTIAMLVRYRF